MRTDPRGHLQGARCDGCALRYAKDRYATEPKVERSQVDANRLKNGWTAEAFEACWVKQEGKCALCRCAMGKTRKQPIAKRWACADHDHRSGKARGILCNVCNMSLGLYENQREAIDAYLELHS